MNRKEIVKEMAARSEKLTRDLAEEALDLLGDILVEAIERGDTAKLVGLVTVEPKPRNARKGYDPINERPIEIGEAVGVKITPGSRLKDAAKKLDFKDFQEGGKHYREPKKKGEDAE